jgi:hypothetical protein
MFYILLSIAAAYVVVRALLRARAKRAAARHTRERFVSRAPAATLVRPDPVTAWRVNFSPDPEPKAPKVNPLNTYAPPGVTFE